MKKPFPYTNLKKTDPEVAKLSEQEDRRQLEELDLIASENFASPAVREASSTSFTNKYSEGYPAARYYPGNEFVDAIEVLCQQRALALFGLNTEDWGVNVQPYSGSPANFEVYTALVEKNDVVLGMELAEGGHLTHGHKVSDSGKFFHFEQYGLNETGAIDFDEVEELARKFRPKLIVCGASAYSQIVDFPRFREIAQRHDALLMADMAHIAGLVAAGVHPSPFPYCDIVTTTTHKTLRGPRGAMIFARTSLIKKVNKSVFPGHQGGPHNNTTAAIAVALKEASGAKFRRYAQQVVKNAKVLARELVNRGYAVVSGGTENHLMLVDLTSMNITGGEAQDRLERVGITANRNAVPNDPRGPLNPSGIRLGTPSLTSRGMRENEMKLLAQLIDATLSTENEEEIDKIAARVKELALRFPPPGWN